MDARVAAIAPRGVIRIARMTPDWIAVDWGTSNLRVWAMGPDGPMAQVQSDDGMGRLARDGFEPALLALIGPWLGAGVVPVMACGMVGSRQGWHEAPYRTVPCTPMDTAFAVTVRTHDPRISLRIAPGLKQTTPADVMRGEETQIAGAMALGAADGVICLPGTHSKWVQISAGEVVSFQTCMTGELFALLSEHSVLRHGMQGDGFDLPGFDTALSDAISRPEKIAARLFSLRAEGLIGNLPAPVARARLSGLLIGIELAATRPYWLGQAVTLVGADAISGLYARALAAQGLTARLLPATDCTLAGLTQTMTPEVTR